MQPSNQTQKNQMARPEEIFSTLRLEGQYTTYVMTVEDHHRMHDNTFIVEGTVLAVEFQGLQQPSKGSYFVHAGVTLQELAQGTCRV